MVSSPSTPEQIKKIESDSWEGPTDFNGSTETLSDSYNKDWNTFLLKYSIG